MAYTFPTSFVLSCIISTLLLKASLLSTDILIRGEMIYVPAPLFTHLPHPDMNQNEALQEREWQRLWLPEQNSSPVIYRMSPKDIKLISQGLLCISLNICGLFLQGVWMEFPWWDCSREGTVVVTQMACGERLRWATGTQRSAAQWIFWEYKSTLAQGRGAVQDTLFTEELNW